MTRNPIYLRTILILSGVLSMPPLNFARAADDPTGLTIRQQPFCRTTERLPVTLYTLGNANGMRVGVIDFGAMLTSLVVPDREGRSADVVLGSDTPEDFLRGRYGAVIGRYANRIGKARFTLDGKKVQVTANAGQNHIHGGSKGFGRVLWHGQILPQQDAVAVQFSYFSEDGEEGFPGNMTCHVTYSLQWNNELKIHYQATTDKPTVINLTNHAYFNLAGTGKDKGKVYDHVLRIDADAYTVADEALIPTGEIRPVKDTPLDFTEPRTIGSRIDQLQKPRGYDHNYVFNDWDGTLRHRVTVYDPLTGRVMELLTTEPGMQLYTANHFRNITGRQGTSYNQHDAFCLETQHFPDSPNHAHFPSTVLRPGKPFDSVTVFRFSTR